MTLDTYHVAGTFRGWNSETRRIQIQADGEAGASPYILSKFYIGSIPKIGARVQVKAKAGDSATFANDLTTLDVQAQAPATQQPATPTKSNGHHSNGNGNAPQGAQTPTKSNGNAPQVEDSARRGVKPDRDLQIIRMNAMNRATELVIAKYGSRMEELDGQAIPAVIQISKVLEAHILRPVS